MLPSRGMLTTTSVVSPEKHHCQGETTLRRDRLGLEHVRKPCCRQGGRLIPRRGMPMTAINVRSGEECTSLFDSSRGTDQGIVSPSTRRKVRNPAEVCKQPHSKLPAGNPLEIVQLEEEQVKVTCSRQGGRSATHKRSARRPCSKFADEEIRTFRSQPSWRKT